MLDFYVAFGYNKGIMYQIGNYIPMHILRWFSFDKFSDLVYTKYINQRVITEELHGKKRTGKALSQGYHTHRGC